MSFKDEKTYTGEIAKFTKNSKGDGSGIVIIDDATQKEIKLDPTSCLKIDTHHKDEKRQKDISTYGENFLFDLENFSILIN
jgi:hypothetical protein